MGHANLLVTGASGVHDLYSKFTGGNPTRMSIDWWEFEPAASK